VRAKIAGLLLSSLGCQRLPEDSATRTHRGEASPALRASALLRPSAPVQGLAAKRSSDPAAAAAPTEAAGALLHEPGIADRDATNDHIVAPPAPIADCEARLAALGVRFTRAELPVHTSRAGVVCGAPQAVVYQGRAGGPRWSTSPLVSCTLALALARFEELLTVEVREKLGSSVRSIEQGGTYNCRKMARFTGMVSEHSYGNAIDLRSFRLADGRVISVLKHFGRPTEEPTAPEGKFLRALARRAYDEHLFSVVLTEFFDPLHRDHFHLDMARYRIDGTR
jgi:hypothetical protein